MKSPEIERLVQLLSKLPGLGPRSARRAVLALIRRRETLLTPLAKVLSETADMIQTCSTCGNIDSRNPCAICVDPGRDESLICVVEDVSDLWALERTRAYKGLSHVLGGTLSALDGVRPESLRDRYRARPENLASQVHERFLGVEQQTEYLDPPNRSGEQP